MLLRAMNVIKRTLSSSEAILIWGKFFFFFQFCFKVTVFFLLLTNVGGLFDADKLCGSASVVHKNNKFNVNRGGASAECL